MSHSICLWHRSTRSRKLGIKFLPPDSAHGGTLHGEQVGANGWMGENGWVLRAYGGMWVFCWIFGGLWGEKHLSKFFRYFSSEHREAIVSELKDGNA